MPQINKTYKHVFVHVPGTAGTSMARQPHVQMGFGHTPIRRLKTLLAKEVPPQEAATYLSWGFVRHPFDRLHSRFYHIRDVQPSWLTRTMIGFEEFVLGLVEYYSERPFSRPMTYYLCDKEGSLAVDFVGRFEHLQRDWVEVCRRLGVPPTVLEHVNKAKSKKKADWRDEFTPQMRAVGLQVYRADFDLWGYDPEL